MISLNKYLSAIPPMLIAPASIDFAVLSAVVGGAYLPAHYIAERPCLIASGNAAALLIMIDRWASLYLLGGHGLLY
jgi:hypothetical protein